MLLLFGERPRDVIADMAETPGWLASKQEPHNSRVHRVVEKLRPKLAALERGRWQLADKGRAAVKCVGTAAAMPEG